MNSRRQAARSPLSPIDNLLGRQIPTKNWKQQAVVPKPFEDAILFAGEATFAKYDQRTSRDNVDKLHERRSVVGQTNLLLSRICKLQSRLSNVVQKSSSPTGTQGIGNAIIYTSPERKSDSELFELERLELELTCAARIPIANQHIVLNPETLKEASGADARQRLEELESALTICTEQVSKLEHELTLTSSALELAGRKEFESHDKLTVADKRIEDMTQEIQNLRDALVLRDKLDLETRERLAQAIVQRDAASVMVAALREDIETRRTDPQVQIKLNSQSLALNTRSLELQEANLERKKLQDRAAKADARLFEQHSEIVRLEKLLHGCRFKSPEAERSDEGHHGNEIASGGIGKSATFLSYEEIPASELEEEAGLELGAGAFAQVLRGWWRHPVAIKKIRYLPRLSSCPPEFLQNVRCQQHLDVFSREARILGSLDHPGICRLYGVHTAVPDLCLVLEFIDGPSLHTLIHRRNGMPWTHSDKLGISLQIAESMAYVHSWNIIHRDLKPDNILVTNAGGIVKIIDFGLAIEWKQESRIDASDKNAGTPVYLPPESLRAEEITAKGDVYAFGVIVWEMVTMKLPWDGLDAAQLVEAVAYCHERLAFTSAFPEPLQELLQSCWESASHLRPKFSEVVKCLKAMDAPPPPRARGNVPLIVAL